MTNLPSSLKSSSSPLLPLGHALSYSTPSSIRLTTNTTRQHQQQQHTNDDDDRSSSNCSLLATSATVVPTTTTRSPTGRIWLSDRRGAFDHMRPKSLLLSTTRVSIIQASTILTNYMTEQLERENEREELLVQGKITVSEMDRQNAEWEESEWKSRWKAFPERATTALLRFHAITLLSRFYETVLFQYILRLSPPTLDRLTKDPFQSALRKQERLLQDQRRDPSRFRNPASEKHNNTNNTTSKETTTATTTIDDIQSHTQLGTRMFQTCLYSNIVAFLADHTVQQCLLAYGYYIYYDQKKKSRSNNNSHRVYSRQHSTESDLSQDTIPAGSSSSLNTSSSSINEESSPPSSSELFGDGEKGGILVSFFHRSMTILASRGLGLGAASLGGAVGSVVFPGWGTTVGIQLGDKLADSLLED